MEAVHVMRDDGQQGTVVQRLTTAEAVPQLVIAFADGSQLVVSEDVLVAQPDGTYHMRLHQTALVKEGTTTSAVDEPLVIPVVAEELTVEKRQVTRGTVRIHTRVETREEVVDEPLRREEVTVERVPVNKLVEGEAPMPHYEQEVFVIPILEEVLVVQKRLLLKEEVRVTRHRTTVSKPQQVTLRREVVEVERVAPSEPSASTTDASGARVVRDS
jgi:uncharacterized protein (TIGR02271 family)